MSLPNAIAAFVKSGGDRTRMLIPLWATTYNCDLDAVRAEYERQMTAASLKPSNSFDESGEGK